MNDPQYATIIHRLGQIDRDLLKIKARLDPPGPEFGPQYYYIPASLEARLQETVDVVHKHQDRITMLEIHDREAAARLAKLESSAVPAGSPQDTLRRLRSLEDRLDRGAEGLAL